MINRPRQRRGGNGSIGRAGIGYRQTSAGACLAEYPAHFYPAPKEV